MKRNLFTDHEVTYAAQSDDPTYPLFLTHVGTVGQGIWIRLRNPSVPLVPPDVVNAENHDVTYKWEYEIG